MSTAPAEGGCLCGRVRFRAGSEPIWVSYCHCKDCRKATGAPVVVFVGFAGSDIEMLGGAATSYVSSPGIKRTFCPRCGSPLSYEDGRLSGEIYFHIGNFDAPERFKPARHGWTSHALSWLHIGDDLPRHERFSRPRPGR